MLLSSSVRATRLLFLILAALTGSTRLSAQTSDAGAIRMNQVGFYPASAKIAIVSGTVSGEQSGGIQFSVISTKTGTIVFSGKTGQPMQSHNSSLITRAADFSSLKTPGNYYLAVPGYTNSGNFTIGNQVYHKAAVAVLKGFYYQRVSTALPAAYAGKWSRAAGHPDTAVYIHASAADHNRPEGTVISSPGGWYDAGDYNKYIVNSGISTSTLLSAYEDFPLYFSRLYTHIPESGNKVPDILNEAIYNIRWMLTMQDPADGGVYHKCTNALFDKMVMPDQATARRYVVQKGTAATLDFVAVMAQSARIFKKYKQQLPGLDDSCMKASLAAWSWAGKYPDSVYNQEAMNLKYSPVIKTGDYGDKVFKDEFFWAASELYASTGNTVYLPAIDKGLAYPLSVPTWSNVQLLGYYALLHPGITLPAGPLKKILTDSFLRLAGKLCLHVQQNAFLTVLGQSPKDFVWGSNAEAANQSIVLLNAYRLSGQSSYLGLALTNLNYIMGQNATGYCFITGAGTHSPLHPHHRQSVADGVTEPVPGLLVGGPNPGMQDKQYYQLTDPETAYTDNDAAYACNEIAINWNAPVVYLLNAAEALNQNN